MHHDTRRITLVARPPQLPERSWDRSLGAESRLVMLDSYTVLRYSMAKPLVDLDVDVERIILDRASSASDYLALLASLPHEFTGDVLMIRDDESGFLSSTGRGGDRVLYALTANDMQFYLEAHELIVRGSSEPKRVLQFQRRIAVA